MSEISGPLLDRIDIHFKVPAVKYAELSGNKSGERSYAVRTGFKKARGIQGERFKGRKDFSKTLTCHGMISSHLSADGQSKEIRQFCRADNAREDLLKWGIKNLDPAPVSTIRSYRELDYSRAGFGKLRERLPTLEPVTTCFPSTSPRRYSSGAWTGSCIWRRRAFMIVHLP